MGGQGEQITDQRRGLRGLSWVRPQMMQQVLSSIALSHDKSPPAQMELLKLFPESRTPFEQDTIASSCPPFANDTRSLSGSSLETQSTADLTIFYNGAFKVRRVSADNAQAVMKLAHSNCLSERATLKPSDGENEEWREIRAGVGMAKKLSQQCFFQKRKDRLGSLAPYATSGKKRSSKGWAEENGDEYEQISLSLSFPSQRCG